MRPLPGERPEHPPSVARQDRPPRHEERARSHVWDQEPPMECFGRRRNSRRQANRRRGRIVTPNVKGTISMTTITLETKLETSVCSECGITYALPAHYKQERREDHRT